MHGRTAISCNIKKAVQDSSQRRQSEKRPPPQNARQVVFLVHVAAVATAAASKLVNNNCTSRRQAERSRQSDEFASRHGEQVSSMWESRERNPCLTRPLVTGLSRGPSPGVQSYQGPELECERSSV
ncbi:hypothetical protein L596_005977 [Steinernema carpocapsae]|uniref:Uncharacterized protein n=1 Tax=Steinernema carpocapsae TaxID=34508 RepID=A0A4U8V5Q4_STECR|nr:hypothetical protein L596_005977 [Steinernema carpocapsae]